MPNEVVVEGYRVEAILFLFTLWNEKEPVPSIAYRLSGGAWYVGENIFMGGTQITQVTDRNMIEMLTDTEIKGRHSVAFPLTVSTALQPDDDED